MMMMFSLYQTKSYLFVLRQFTITTVRGQTCWPIWTHYPDSELTSLCSFSLMLRAQRRGNKYKFHSLWFDPTGARTHDLLGANHYTTDAVLNTNKDHNICHWYEFQVLVRVGNVAGLHHVIIYVGQQYVNLIRAQVSIFTFTTTRFQNHIHRVRSRSKD